LSFVVANVEMGPKSELPSMSKAEMLASIADFSTCLFGSDDRVFNTFLLIWLMLSSPAN
jgi:hypothetical protein